MTAEGMTETVSTGHRNVCLPRCTSNVINEGIDCTTPAGKLQLYFLAALAEFERARIQERVRAGLARARAQGVKLGRPRRYIDPERLASVAGLPEREAARRLGIPRSTFQRFREQSPLASGSGKAF